MDFPVSNNHAEDRLAGLVVSSGVLRCARTFEVSGVQPLETPHRTCSPGFVRKLMPVNATFAKPGDVVFKAR
jgi:hypothetical protein